MTHTLPIPALLHRIAASTTRAFCAAGCGMLPRNARVVSRCDASLPRVALTFEDGPHPGSTPRILDVLRDIGARATFFVVGRRVAQHPDLVERIAEEGHLIGNHSFDHHPFAVLGRARYWEDQLERLDFLVERITGLHLAWFRPPAACSTPGLLRAAVETRHAIVTFSREATAGSPERLVPRARAGDILALHDGPDPNFDSPPGASAASVKRLVEGLRSRGLETAPLDRLIKPRPYLVEPEPAPASRLRRAV
jgi:peptidoglycan/xylan/chitin deacetylase (PgdA/CDA1 family)